MPIFAAQELTYTKLRELEKQRTVCFLPVSALEVHGPHLPLGMDFYMARWMAEESGRRFCERHPEWNVVQYPALPLGTDELPLAGSMNTNQSTVYRALLHHGESLVRAGYRYIVVTNGHGGPRHASALEAACQTVSRQHGVQMFTPSIVVLHEIVTGAHLPEVEKHIGRKLSENEKEGLLCGEHAGAWETSFMLAQDSSLVEADYVHLQRDAPPKFPLAVAAGNRLAAYRDRRGGDGAQMREMGERLAGGIGWLLNARYGYGGPSVTYQGTPAVASAAIGHAFRELLAAECLRIVEDVTAGRRPASTVRSLASESPLVQPGFWRNLGGAAALLAALFWVI